MASTELRPGDVVRLKSGGPRMTVRAVGVGTDQHVECQWFTTVAFTALDDIPLYVDSPNRDTFHTDSLEVVRD